MPSTASTMSSTKKSAKSVKEETPKMTAAEPEVELDVEHHERKRRDISKESVDGDFDTLQNRIEQEIQRLRGSNEKTRGVKFLRSVNKALKMLHSDTKRVMKLKKRNNRKKAVVSGFLKPVRISAELADFTGWNVNDTHSRVATTKFICEYIKSHNLRNETDKRLILCDEKLGKLLKYDPNNPPLDEKGQPAPLNYFRLQKYLKSHFIKIADTKRPAEPVVVPAHVEPAKTSKSTPAPKPKSSTRKAVRSEVLEED